MLTFAFYKAPGTWRDRVIRLGTRSIYSHVEFVLRRYQHNGEDRMFSVSASKRDGHQVRKTSMVIQPGHWDFVTVEGDYADAMMLAGSMCGLPYNTIGAVLSITPWRWPVGTGLHCSQFTGIIAGIPDPHMLCPQEFHEAINRGLTVGDCTSGHNDTHPGGRVAAHTPRLTNPTPDKNEAIWN